MQPDDFPRTAAVELLDAYGNTLCRRAAAWDGTGFVVDLADAEVSATARVRITDAEGLVLGEVPAQVPALPDLKG